MRVKTTLFLLFTIQSFFIGATLKLPEFIGDNMVLQKNSTIKLWGLAKKNTIVKIKTSWDIKFFESISSDDGKWEVFIQTEEASFQKQSIEISDGEILKIQNILIGEVWLCSGQSNMEMTFKGFKNEAIKDATFFINNANKDLGIRMLNVQKTTSSSSSYHGKGKWKENSVENLPSFSAAAYFFALQLQKNLNTPVGIINSSFGGSSIEGWLDSSSVQKYSDLDYKTSILDTLQWKRPCVIYEAMLKPYKDYSISGVVWYQGESNVGRYATYAQKFQDLISLWRSDFNNQNLPFYVVEIAPFEYSELSQAAKLREAQFKGVILDKNSYFVSTNDLVLESESKNIHPSQKKQIGERLANLALHSEYHFDSIQPFSPNFQSSNFTSDSIILSFENCYDGLLNNQEIVGFEVADSSMIFQKTDAKIGSDSNTIIIINRNRDFIPVSVRYCFKNFQLGNVKNSVGLPLIPFRTDNWEK